MTDSIKYILEENKLPKTWYNINADLPSPPPHHYIQVQNNLLDQMMLRLYFPWL